VGLISIIQIEKEFVLFYEIHAQISSCNRRGINLDYTKINITSRVHGAFYNFTTDTLYFVFDRRS
jgi:hypothetical protein